MVRRRQHNDVAAYGIHKQLVDEAFDPTSDDYYDELDKRIRGEFPHKFSDTGAKRRTAQTVAGVSRTSSFKRAQTGKTHTKPSRYCEEIRCATRRIREICQIRRRL